MGNPILHALINGVENTKDLGGTQQEFEAMRAIDQQRHISEYLADVVEIFVKEEQAE